MTGGILMKNLKIINVSHDQAYHLICENLNHCKTMIPTIVGAKYDHNIPYNKVSNAIKYGLLSIEELYKLEGKTLTPEQKIKYSREGGHINGIDEISLASMDIDFNNLYRNERVFNPYSLYSADILISDQIKAYRITEHYANEYLTGNKILTEHFKAIDIRLLKYFKERYSLTEIEEGVNNYNCLLEFVFTLVNEGLNIPIREMSEEGFALDKQKVLELPKIQLK